MMDLATLQNTHRPKVKIQRVGRGFGSRRGKTCGRGSKGDKARSGYKRRYGQEGGQLPLYRKIPCRGFPNGRFASKVFSLNLRDLDRWFQDGETVSFETLYAKGLVTSKYRGGIKILAAGELHKKVSIQAQGISQEAQKKLTAKGIPFTVG
ncbi:MAG: 50S ribosomal protein L15 [Chlamydiae bacterium]|nr:50S ribosomal protein L15 [Chlamydiota bacterium]